MELKNPLNFFHNQEETESLVLETGDSLREELSKVENLSDQLSKLQQEIYQKVVEQDSVVIFKQQVSELSNIVSNLIENEIPKYKKQVAGNEIRLSSQVTNFKEDIDQKIENFYQKINEFNDVIQVLETVSSIETYIQEHHKNFVSLREELFNEINQIPVGSIQNHVKRLERKLDLIAENYSQIESQVISEGLLNEPPNTNNTDPLTPLNQKFVTLDQLQEHYRLFVNRVQQQLSTIGGGGETKLKYLDDIVGIATNSSAYDNKYLKYDHSVGKFIFGDISGSIGAQGTVGAQGIQGIIGVQGIQGTVGTQGIQGITGAGTQGITGAQGIQGITGTGTQGTTGAQGITGTGTQGTTGTQGIQGIAGGSQTLDQTLVIGNTSSLGINIGVITATDYRIQSVSEKTTLVSGNTVSLVYNTGGGNIAICTNPSGDISLSVAGIPTDSNFNNRSLTFSVIVSNTGTARSCTAVTLNGVSRTIKWFGGSLSAAISGVTTSSGYDIYNFTGINTVGSASTTTNYDVLGTVNGGYR